MSMSSSLVNEVLQGDLCQPSDFGNVTLALWNYMSQPNGAGRQNAMTILTRETKRARSVGAVHCMNTALALCGCASLLYLKGSAESVLETVDATLHLLNRWIIGYQQHTTTPQEFFQKDDENDLKTAFSSFQNAQASLLQYLTTIPSSMKERLREHLLRTAECCLRYGENKIADVFKEQCETFLDC